MRFMFIITSMLLLLSTCEKSTDQYLDLSGIWGLVQTELYENETFSASAAATETTTYYAFETDETSRLTISEDGESETYLFQYDPAKSELIIGQEKVYAIERLTSTELIISIQYASYKSRYSFFKVQ